MTGVDRIIVGRFKYKNIGEIKGKAIIDKQLIDEVVVIANQRLAQKWNPFVGIINAECGINLHFFSGTSYLGNLAFSNATGGRTIFTLREIPKRQIYQQKNSHVDSKLLQKLFGSSGNHKICDD
ncbi:MAG: hypothetical protein KJ899_04905 [Gammaproteobacteria bacterium]|nr:hypothetical protein [Gammaproteobacteria bacterium]